jgi:hypothetical protein
MALVQDDHVVQAFTADTPDQPLDVRILPRRARGHHDLLDSHMPDALPKVGALDIIAIAQQIAWSYVPGEGFHRLLSCPLRRRMFRDVDMYHAARFMGQDEQDEEHFVGHGRHHKEIEGHQVLHVIRERALPRRRR